MVHPPAGEQSVHSIVGSGIADGVDALIAPFNVVTHFNQLGYQRLGFLIFLREQELPGSSAECRPLPDGSAGHRCRS